MEDQVSRFFTMLGHPLRRKIIQYLAEHERGGFTELKAYLKVSTGTLYYQLDLLNILVEQDEDKKYRLNEKGKFAHHLLLESGERLAASRFAKRNASVVGYVTLWLIGWRLISRLYGMPTLATPFAAIILIYGAWVTYLSGLYPVVFIYMERLALPPVYIPLLFLSGYLLVNVLANTVSFAIYRTKEGAKHLLLGSALAYLPSIIFPTAYVIAKGLQAPLTVLQAQALMLVGMGYSLLFLVSAISLSKGLAAEKAALSASVTLYASLGLAFMLTNL